MCLRANRGWPSGARSHPTANPSSSLTSGWCSGLQADQCGLHAQDVKHHPASVDLELIKRLAATTRSKSLQQFLYKDFSCISKDYAGAGPSPWQLLQRQAEAPRAPGSVRT